MSKQPTATAKLPHQSLGDVVDKITILSRKIFFGEEEAYKEHTYLCESVNKLGLKLSGALLASIVRLSQANFEIWNRENELRKASEDDPTAGLSLEEAGRRAIEIRDFNRKRIRHKNEINRLTKLGFREFKVKHRSQG